MHSYDVEKINTGFVRPWRTSGQKASPIETSDGFDRAAFFIAVD
jgi:hypothetical protein